jgi:hypothetical protein
MIRKDVLVKAPPGIWRTGSLPDVKEAADLTKDDIIQMQAVDISHLREEIEIQKYSAETMARFAICLIHIFREHTGSDVVRVPAELYERMKEAEIQIAQPEEANGDVFGRYVEKYDGKMTLPTGVIR